MAERQLLNVCPQDERRGLASCTQAKGGRVNFPPVTLVRLQSLLRRIDGCPRHNRQRIDAHAPHMRLPASSELKDYMGWVDAVLRALVHAAFCTRRLVALHSFPTR